MSLMNCTFTVRWSDEKNEPHVKTYETEAAAKKAKKMASGSRRSERRHRGQDK